MSDLTNISIAEVLARLTVASVFILAGLAKLSSPWALARDIEAYRLFPSVVSRVFGHVLPFVELTLGLLLVAGFATGPTALAVTLLCIAFVVASVSAIWRDLNIDCGCFGLLSRQRIGRNTISRDLLLILPCVYVAQFTGPRLAGGTLVRSSMGAEQAAALFATFLTVMLVTWAHRRNSLKVERRAAATPGGPFIGRMTSDKS